MTAVGRKLVYGTQQDLVAAMQCSTASTTINMSLIGRQNGSDRSYNARKPTKTCEFSKDLLVHVAVSWWVFFCYTFDHLHRGLRIANADGSFLHRTPAMAFGLKFRPCSVVDIITTQVVRRTPAPPLTLADFRRPQARGSSL